MKNRILLLAALALLLAALFAAAGVGVRTAHADQPPGGIDDGCSMLISISGNPVAIDVISFPRPGLYYNTGDVIITTVSKTHHIAPTATLFSNGEIVAQTSVPGTMFYTIPASGIYDLEWRTLNGSWVVWTLTCVRPVQQPWFYTQPPADAGVLDEVQTLPFEGRQACGAFTADWWGVKVLLAENFPACADYLPDHVEVACLNEHAEWTTDYVKNPQAGGGIFSAALYQHGTCALFPAP